MKTRLTRAAAFLLSCGLFMPTLSAAADSQGLEGFDPENLISDANMYGDVAFSMDADDIQEFLDEKGSACVRGADGSPCLKDATFATTSYSASPWCPAAFEGSDSDSAAEVIAKAAQACRISPKVLIVLLQKEQGLVTTHNPTKRAYAKATGFACPDTAPCDPSKAGFATQVYAAASRLQQYRLQPERFNHAVGRTSTVGYHPNPACGSQLLTMATAATAALYNYTPYLPNAAALANPKGTGDRCSAYGNRNFFRLHSEWFGKPNSTTETFPSKPEAHSSSSAADTRSDTGAHTNHLASRPQLNNKVLSPLSDLTGDKKADLLLAGSPLKAPGDGWGDGSKIDVAEVGAAIHSANEAAAKQDVVESRRIGAGWNSNRAVSAGDWNKDGSPDFLLAMPDGILKLYEGRPNYTWGAVHIIGRGWQSFSPLIGGLDFDGDSNMDIVARNLQTGELRLYSGDGNIAWKGARTIGTGWEIFSHLSVVPDWRNGNPAVVGVESKSGRMRVYPTNGRGQFTGRIDLGYGWDAFESVTGTFDITGDGHGDLTAISSAGGVVTFASKGNSFEKTTERQSNLRLSRIFSTRGEGEKEMVAISRDGGMHLLTPKTRIVPAKAVAARRSTGIGVGVGEKLLNVGDWDGDGRHDLLRWTSTKHMVLHSGLSGGTWDLQGRTIGSGWDFSDVIAVSDWDGSGKPGLLAWDETGGDIKLYPGNGQGAWGVPTTIGTGLTWADAILDGGNWNSQGGVQLIVRRASTGTLELLTADASGINASSPRRIGTGWDIMRTISGIGDADGDGKDDILALRNDGKLLLYTGAGNSAFKDVHEVDFK